MFGPTNPFGQSSTSPFGQNSFGTQQGFGQATPAANNPFAPKPFGSPTTTFGAQTGSSLFGTTSTGAFGQQQSTPTFGTTSTASFGQQQSTPAFGTPSSSPFGSSPAFGASPTPAFGATSSTFGSGSLFGQKPSFGGFGSSPSQSSPFGGTFQQTQPTFGSSTFGASTTPAFGTTTTPAFGATAPAFGTTTTPAFGATTTPAFGSTSPSLFGASSTPAFGSSAPGFGTSATTPFGVSSSTTGFGSSSTPSFGTSTNAFSFGPSPSFGQTTVASGSSPFGTTSPFGVQTPAFGSQTTVPTFGQAQFCNQAGGTSIKLYAQTPDVDGATSVTQPAKLDSISAMPEYKDKSHEELRWEDYQRGDKGGSNPSGTPTVTPTSSTPPNTFTTNSAFNQTTPNPFSSNNPFAKNGSTSALLFNTSFNNTSVASLSPFTSSTSTTIFGQTGVSVFPASSSPSLFPNAAPTFASSSLFGTSTPNNSSLFGTGLSLANAQLAPPFQSFIAFTQQPSSTLAFSSGNLFRTLNTGSLFGSRPSLFTTPTYQQSAPAQTSSMFSFQPPPQPGGLPGFSNIANQALIGQQTSHYMVMQPAPVSNPFGTLPAMPQMSIGNGGSCSSVQYGILSLPVAEKPLPIRTLSVAVPRHLLQRRIKFLLRKYNPISDGKVPFFADDAESPATPKAGAFFIPRENPRNLIICPLEQWPSHSGINRQSVPKDSAGLDKYEDASTEKAVKSPRCSPLVENGKQHEPSHHGNGKGTSVKGLLPKLPQADYFTEPNLEELAAKERGEPGYCGLVEDFVVGRHGYGSIKFLGETDVRGLDLESVVEFNNREVIVYKDDSKKPPVGEGLNKAAEVTLLNIKCVNTKTGEEYLNGPQVDSYTQMLVRMTEEQGAEFVSFDVAMGEWKFRVEHFSTYGLWDVAGESEERRVLQKERDAESACQIKKIIWDDDTTSLFNHICSQEITQGNMEVGKLSVEILCEKLAKEGIQCTNYQIQNKWDDLKRLHSFWHNQVLGSKVKIKDEKFWKRVLKSRESKIEYRNLRHGPPQDIEYLDIMFGKKSAQNSSRRDQQLKKDPDCLQITVQELKEERENLKNDLEKVKEERENLKNDLKKVKEEFKSAQDSSRRAQQLKKDLDCLQITVQELKEERENLKNDLEKVKEERENLKNDLKKVKEEFKLIGMQKDMEKQLSTMIPASVAKESKKLETSLGRSMEKSIKAHIDTFWVRLQEENTKREKADRERMQQLVTLITNSINKDIPANLEKSLKKEISSLGPVVARAITPIIEKCLASVVSDSVQKGVGDKVCNQLDKSISGKLEATLARQIQMQFHTSVKQALQDALHTSFESLLVPAFEQSCKTMFEQVDGAFQKGMSEHTVAIQQQVETAHTPLALTLKETINSASSITQSFSSELLDGQRKLLALVASGNVKAHNTNSLQPVNGPMGGPQEVEAPLDPMKELGRLISERKFDEAFTMALQRSDVSIVSWLCSQVDLRGLLAMVPLPLNQGVLLALLQQLAVDLNNETSRKVQWMTDVAMAINPAAPTIAVHVRPIFEASLQPVGPPAGTPHDEHNIWHQHPRDNACN